MRKKKKRKMKIRIATIGTKSLLTFEQVSTFLNRAKTRWLGFKLMPLKLRRRFIL